MGTVRGSRTGIVERSCLAGHICVKLQLSSNAWAIILMLAITSTTIATLTIPTAITLTMIIVMITAMQKQQH